MPPSLKNIFKEIKNDLNIDNQNSDLTCWAKQGVLLLNSSLTVRQYCSNSHKKFWEQKNVTVDNIFKYISNKLNNIIFVLWGNYAKKKKKFINTNKHHILESVHPSPLSAHRGFFGNKHFSKINTILDKHNHSPINWQT